MLKFSSAAVLVGTSAVLGLWAGCSSDDSAPATQKGGAAGTSTTSSGGRGGSGGSSTTTTTSGGGAGSGGRATGGSGGGATGGGGSGGGGSGGKMGMDAAGGTAGSAGSAGSSGSGGTGVDDGGMEEEAAPPPKPDGSAGVKYTFDTNTLDGWHYAPYGSTPPSGNPPGDPNNLANRSVPLAWDGADDADNKTDASGSLQESTPFAYAQERIDVQAFSTGTNVRDWTGYVINAQVKLVSGGNFSPDCPLQGHLYVSTAPSYDTRVSAPASLVKGQWVTITYDMADTGLNTSMINQMGIQVDTGGDCPFDAGAPAVSDASTDSADAGPPDVSVADASADGGAPEASDDAGDAAVPPPPPPPQATTAVILIDNVIVSVK